MTLFGSYGYRLWGSMGTSIRIQPQTIEDISNTDDVSISEEHSELYWVSSTQLNEAVEGFF